MEPASIVEDTEQTQFSLQTNGRTEDRWTDNMKWLYPLNLVYREQGVCVCVSGGWGGWGVEYTTSQKTGQQMDMWHWG